MADRLGPSLGEWLELPFAFALWSWHQLQDLDRGRRWSERMARVEAAQLTAMAYHNPKQLDGERQTLLNQARRRPEDREAEQDRAHALARRLRRALRHPVSE